MTKTNYLYNILEKRIDRQASSQTTTIQDAILTLSKVILIIAVEIKLLREGNNEHNEG